MQHKRKALVLTKKIEMLTTVHVHMMRHSYLISHGEQKEKTAYMIYTYTARGKKKKCTNIENRSRKTITIMTTLQQFVICIIVTQETNSKQNSILQKEKINRQQSKIVPFDNIQIHFRESLGRNMICLTNLNLVQMLDNVRIISYIQHTFM